MLPVYTYWRFSFKPTHTDRLHLEKIIRARFAPWNWFKPSSKIFLLTVPRRYFFCGSFVFFVCPVFLMLWRLFIAALWSPARKRLTSWLFLVMFILFCYFPMWYPGSDVVLDCIVSWSLSSFLLWNRYTFFETVISWLHIQIGFFWNSDYMVT